MMKSMRMALLGAVALLWLPALAATQVESLTLEQALQMAEKVHPELAEANAMIAAAEGRALQAGALPNPEAILGANQLPLSTSAPNEREYVAGAAQVLPLSGRLSKARKAELLEREVRARSLQVKRRDVRKRVHTAFATALYQERAYDAQNGIVQNAEKAVAATRARLEAGDALLEDLARVEMEVARAKVELQRAGALRQQALVTLVSAVGDPSLSVSGLAGTLEMAFDMPTIESLTTDLVALPESARAEADLRAWNARIDAARAERIPEVKVELLYHRLEATRSDTIDVGLSVPVPLFNRNQGRLREARAELAAAEARSRMTQNDLTRRLRETHLELTAALAASSSLKRDVLPRAETLLKGAEARYAAGDISLAEVLPVRRDWAAMQLSYLESLRDVMQAWGELRSLMR